MTDAAVIPEQAPTESNFWASVPENDAVCVELERGGEVLTEVYIDREACPTEFSFKMLVKKLYGGGRFRAVMRDSDTKRFIRTLSFSVAGVPIVEKEQERHQPAQSGELAAILAAMQQQNQAVLATLEKIGSGTSMKDALAMIADVQKINGSGRSSLEGLREFMEFKTLARELAGEEAAPKADGFAELLKIAAPLLGEVVKQGTEQERLKAALALKKAQLAAGKTAPAAAPKREPLPPEVAEQLAQLLDVAGLMPAEELAAVVAEQLDDEQAQAVVDAIDGTDWMAQLIEQEPRAKDHAEWLETFAAKLLDLLTDEPEQPDATAETQGAEAATGQPGHAANAATDGAADKAGESESKRTR